MKNYFTIKRYGLIVLFAILGVCQVYGNTGGETTYYAKAKAEIGKATGEGKVYASVDQTNNPQYGNSNTTDVKSAGSRTGSATITFYMYAQAEEGSEFTGWSTTADKINQIENSNTLPYQYNVNSNVNNANEATVSTLYAIFEKIPLFYFSATATAVPNDAGTASVNPATMNVFAEHWNSSSASTNQIAFKATDGPDYTFTGWSATENGGIVSTDNPYYPNLTSNSKDSDKPTNTTYYARFIPYPTGITATPTSLTLGVGESSAPITATVSPTGAYSNITFESSNPSVASVDANGVVTAGSSSGNAMITVKALKSDGSTVRISTTVPVKVLERCKTPAITFNPFPDGNTATVVLSTATDGATIYYTTDGSKPTTSSTPYTTTFTINNGQTVKAIAVRDDYLDSYVAAVVYSATKVATPTINITTSGVSFGCDTEGVSYYYTTNGDTPTTSSAQWNGTPITGLAEGVTIKVIAAKSGMIISDMATKTYYPASNVDGTTVTLNDFEDHNWTYYSGVDEGNYNTKYADKLYSPNPRNVKITYNGVNGILGSSTKVRVSIDESETTFVYYKTLEEATSENYPYQVISNPFSVRPSTGSGGSKVYYGFAGWKIVSGHQYIKRANGTMAAEGATLSLDEEITFVGLPYPSVNCISAEIVFETTWKIANRTYVSSNPNNAQTYEGDGDYESNFYVINCDYTRTITTSGPVTIMMVEPDGSNNYRTKKFSGYITPSNTGVTKIEFANWSPGNNGVNPGGRNLTIGRGMVMDTRRALYGTNSTSAVNQILKVESGHFSTFTHYGQNPSSITKQWIYFGNDYDRARNNNSTLTFSELFMVGEGRELGLSPTEEMCRTISISGSFMTGIEISTGAANYSYYLGIKSTHNNGHRYFEVQGGEWYANIAGGMGKDQDKASRAFTFRMKGGIIRGSIYGAGAFAPAGGERRYIITGGNIGGWVAAGCNGIGGNTTQTNNGATNGDSYVYVGGNAKIGYQNRTINDVAGGNVFGAGRGAPVTTYNVGTINNSNIVVADKAEIENNVYGGGNYGFSLDEANIYVLGGTVDGRVFGGANMTKGYSPSIIMNGGTVKDGVYGGCNTEGTINNNVTMQINGGQVGTSSQTANIHGGGYGQATRVSGKVEVTLGTTSQTTEGVVVWGDVYGGSALGYVNGTTANDTYHTYVTLNKGTINGSLYGGGLGSNTVAANVYGPVKVTVNGGSVKATSAAGSGGVYGANNIKGAPQRSVTVDIYGTDPAPAEGQYALHAVYGGGNQADYLYGNGYPTVTVHNCDNSIEYVYGGGNAAAVAATDVTIYGGNVIGNVFGGGNGESGTAADVNGNVDLKIYGGTILNVFGGSNSLGNINGSVKVNVNSLGEGEKTPCPMIIGNVYGGGNEANGNAGTLTIGCTGTLVEGDEGHVAHPEEIGKTLEGIGAVYGGANNADIGKSDARSNITLNINSGMVANVFGGNNTGGNIYGDITVNVNKNAETCGWYVGNVYGAGNLAAYTGSPVVNIQNGTVSGNVFGGGLGETAIVSGNPQVTIGDAVAGHEAYVATVGGDVYGGGDAANVEGIPVVNIVNKCNTTIGNVYGGGNAADVKGTDVNIDGGTITGMVFGGGHGDNSVDPQISANVIGDVNLDITGGTINKVFGGSNSMGNITGSIALNIQKDDEHCGMYIAEVYGGGNEADGNAGSLTIGCTGALVEGDNGHVAHPEKIGKELEGIGAVYGGANNANIGNDVTLNINSGMVAKVFGGNNTGGTVNGNVTVNVNKNANACGWYVGKVHGGGYGKETNVAKDVTVNIENGTIYGDVYGGSALGKVNTDINNTTTVNLTGGLIKGDAYGGGLGDSTTEADVNGNVTVTLNGTAFELTTIKDDYDNTIPTSGRIFGCNNINGSPKGTVLVWVQKTVGPTNEKPAKGSGIYELQAVYGGGNLAAYEPTNAEADGQFTSYTYNSNTVSHDNQKKPVQVVIDGCDETSIEYVYGGGNAASTPATDVLILGSYEIGNVFGGGNGKDRYTLDGTNWNANDGADVGIINAAAYDANKTEGKYGTGYAMTSVLGGTVNNIFGGSNTKGNIVGQATTRLDQASNCQLVVKDIYGGGNEAYMDGNTNIQLGCIEYLKEIYGGAKNADVGSDINMTITSGHFDRVFGGNNLGGKIRGSITVNIEETGCNPITIGEIYGGGNKAAYSVYGYSGGTLNTSGAKLYNDPVVNILSFTSIGRVFGGGLGEEAVMVGSPTVNINEVVGANASNTSWPHLNKTINFNDGTASVTLPLHEAGKIGAIGTVFGGGNAAKVIGDTNVNIGTADDIIGVDIRGNVYGGGNQADVTGKTNVTIGK